MNVAVVGGGVVGALTAYFLQTRGCQVTVFDQANEPASTTSRANGGQLSYSFCDAMADPQLLPRLPGIVLGADPAFRIRPSLNLDFLSWGLKFISQCRKQRRDDNTRALLQLAQRSATLMEPLKQLLGDRATFGCEGKLVLLNHAVDGETQRRIELKRTIGLDISVLNPDEIVRTEPALGGLTETPVAAIYSRNDEAADAHQFTRCLMHYMKNNGVICRFGTAVQSVQPADQGVYLSLADEQKEAYDAVVLATGNSAQQLLAPHGIKLPILGMSGYSWTFPAIDTSPVTSITALSKRIVFSRLGDVVRVAGFADVNLDPSRAEERATALRAIARELLPDAADYDNPVGTWWHGVRAMTPDSRPILGATSLPRVYTNLGHGMLGWTLGAATADQVAQEITNNAG